MFHSILSFRNKTIKAILRKINIIQGYDAGEDNAEIGQPMYIPKRLTTCEPEIRPKDPKRFSINYECWTSHILLLLILWSEVVNHNLSHI